MTVKLYTTDLTKPTSTETVGKIKIDIGNGRGFHEEIQIRQKDSRLFISASNGRLVIEPEGSNLIILDTKL